jgi:hypothetical protein
MLFLCTRIRLADCKTAALRAQHNRSTHHLLQLLGPEVDDWRKSHAVDSLLSQHVAAGSRKLIHANQLQKVVALFTFFQIASDTSGPHDCGNASLIQLLMQFHRILLLGHPFIDVRTQLALNKMPTLGSERNVFLVVVSGRERAVVPVRFGTWNRRAKRSKTLHSLFFCARQTGDACSQMSGEVSAEENATWLSKGLNMWIQPLLKRGSTEVLTPEIIWRAHERHMPDANAAEQVSCLL